MQLFQLERNEDETGISGTGVVAEGCEFSDGRVALVWQTATPTAVVHPSIQTVEQIHGHGGKTQIRFQPLRTGAQFLPPLQAMYLHHSEDRYGLTRVGTVAECAIFSNGWVAMCWLVKPYTIELHPSYDAWMHIHASQTHTNVMLLPDNSRRSHWLDAFLSEYRWYRDWTGGDWYQVRAIHLQGAFIGWTRSFYPETEHLLNIEAR